MVDMRHLASCFRVQLEEQNMERWAMAVKLGKKGPEMIVVLKATA